VTQLGNQGHSSDSIRQVCEWIWAGAIGQVHTIHAGCDSYKHVYCQIPNLGKLNERHEVPKGLDYDRWLGPAQFRAYSPLWVPWNWRGWMPFGSGTIGDWICHVIDPGFCRTSIRSPPEGGPDTVDETARRLWRQLHERRWRHPDELLEHPIEVLLAPIPDFECDWFDLAGLRRHHLQRAQQARTPQVFRERHAEGQQETATQLSGRDAEHGGEACGVRPFAVGFSNERRRQTRRRDRVNAMELGAEVLRPLQEATFRVSARAIQERA